MVVSLRKQRELRRVPRRIREGEEVGGESEPGFGRASLSTRIRICDSKFPFDTPGGCSRIDSSIRPVSTPSPTF